MYLCPVLILESALKHIFATDSLRRNPKSSFTGTHFIKESAIFDLRPQNRQAFSGSDLAEARLGWTNGRRETSPDGSRLIPKLFEISWIFDLGGHMDSTRLDLS